VKVNLQI